MLHWRRASPSSTGRSKETSQSEPVHLSSLARSKGLWGIPFTGPIVLLGVMLDKFRGTVSNLQRDFSLCSKEILVREGWEDKSRSARSDRPLIFSYTEREEHVCMSYQETLFILQRKQCGL